MKIKIFGKQNCAKCETTKNKINHYLKKNTGLLNVPLEFYDLDTIDGIAEGAYNDVLKIPTTIIEENENTLARWDGEVPKTEEFSSYIT
jgi:hypothetical protein